MSYTETRGFRYSYDGPVLEFGKVIATNWKSTTTAPSERKARCNFAYQFKTQTNRTSNTKIELPGEIRCLK